MMNTPLESVNLTADDIAATTHADVGEHEGEESHASIHMPNGSLWPLYLSLAIVVTMAGILVASTFPWITIIGAIFVLVCIVGWGVEDPFASRTGAVRTSHVATSYAEAAQTGQPTVLAEMLLQDAQDVADSTVTVGSTAGVPILSMLKSSARASYWHFMGKSNWRLSAKLLRKGCYRCLASSM